MARFFGELLFELARSLIGGLLERAVLKAGAWLDARVPGRRTRIVAGLLLGVAAYFLIPVLAGLLGL
ncbi:hypothetical protein JQ617_34185 [Bradyrhizobium sp. KB893862 SZCCT0404]|uniref:hypothetical protein n=1 Tax=Bradyrhizobium sp. KB893862 SZCCT0404 TaxID=2807672 RepID=UPI001BA5F8D3|nr:hypothetical protein [Bradyrhizobium sp. KB893862 SZCCT0404]MBR1179056.1 hypothetical protein [Bradyrhizobium sp. KB893862 SZCCT0404]